MAVLSDLIDSSMISDVQYDTDSNVLLVRFNNGSLYAYEDVDEDTYYDIVNASSAGGYFADNVRFAYNYLRLENRMNEQLTKKIDRFLKESPEKMDFMEALSDLGKNFSMAVLRKVRNNLGLTGGSLTLDQSRATLKGTAHGKKVHVTLEVVSFDPGLAQYSLSVDGRYVNERKLAADFESITREITAYIEAEL